MVKFLRLTAAPFFALLVLMAGCSTEQTQATPPSPTPTPSLSTEPAPSPITSAAPSPQTNSFQDASDKAISAETISESAQSQNDWDLVAGMWLEAIDLMKAVPTSSPSYSLAQKKAKEYQQNLAYAKQQSVKPATSPELTVVEQPLDAITEDPTKASPPKPISAYEKIMQKERASEASVNKFMKDYFEGVVNKGQTGTGSWCAASYSLASYLHSPQSWEILDITAYPDANIASVVARIESSTKGGAPVRKNWKFALEKGDTYLEKTMLKEGATDSYNYSKTNFGGWCLHLLTED